METTQYKPYNHPGFQKSRKGRVRILMPALEVEVLHPEIRWPKDNFTVQKWGRGSRYWFEMPRWKADRFIKRWLDPLGYKDHREYAVYAVDEFRVTK